MFKKGYFRAGFPKLCGLWTPICESVFSKTTPILCHINFSVQLARRIIRNEICFIVQILDTVLMTLDNVLIFWQGTYYAMFSTRSTFKFFVISSHWPPVSPDPSLGNPALEWSLCVACSITVLKACHGGWLIRTAVLVFTLLNYIKFSLFGKFLKKRYSIVAKLQWFKCCAVKSILHIA